MSWIAKLIDHMIDRTRNTWRRPAWWSVIIALPWALGVFFLVYQYKTDLAVAGRQKTVVGVITAHEPANHNRYGYTFTVESRSHQGWGSPSGAEPKMGQQVLVYYDPLDPDTNALSDFNDLSTGSLGPVPVLLIGIAAIVFAVAFLRWRNRPEKSSRRSADNEVSP